VRVATWNMNGATGKRARRLGDFLARIGKIPRVVMLQEAADADVERFCEAAGLDWCVCVKTAFGELMSVRGRSGRSRGVALAGSGSPLRSPIALPDVPLPEKVIAGWLEIDGELATVVSYHAPPGVTHKLKKPAQAVQVAEWLASIEGPVLFAGDFNTPKIDHPDLRQLRTHWHTGDAKLLGATGDDVLVGPTPIHSLRDVLRTYLYARPDVYDQIASERPTGPLYVSHRTGNRRNPRRYDAIWASPHFSVDNVAYMYDEAIAAGTDHALVVADLRLR
jgi:endonuclease/exonuclease/phosphatase family metal-dependent hydrolase